MNICKIWDADYPWDVRVEKICRSLIASGHEVHLVCRNRQGRPTEECIEGIQIHRLPIYTSGIRAPLGFPFFLNPVWLRSISKVVSRYPIDVIVVRDLPLALSGAMFSRIAGIPCVLDMAEPYPEMLAGYGELQELTWSKKATNTIVRNSDLARGIEKLACRALDHVVAVSEEIKLNLVGRGADASRITVVHNSPRMSEIAPALAETGMRATENSASHSLRIVYVGDLTEARGVPIVVRAVKQLVQRGESFQFVIIGKGRHEAEIRRVVREEGVQSHVEFRGFVPHDQLAHELEAMDIGVIPHIDTLHNNLTLPNKVFDYMASGLPVVSADLIPIRRIIDESSCGLVHGNGDVDSLAAALLQLKDPMLRTRLGSNGRKAAIEKYNWDVDYGTLEAVLLALHKGASSRRRRRSAAQ